MATKTLCKGVLCISPVCFLLFTFYVLFVAKKDGKRTGSVVGASVKNSQRKHLVECASNFYPGNPSGHAAACSPCPVGHFSFRGWIACIPYLDCSNIALNVRIRRRIGTPLVVGKWLHSINTYRTFEYPAKTGWTSIRRRLKHQWCHEEEILITCTQVHIFAKRHWGVGGGRGDLTFSKLVENLPAV